MLFVDTWYKQDSMGYLLAAYSFIDFWIIVDVLKLNIRSD